MEIERQKQNFRELLHASYISSKSEVIRITNRQLKELGIDIGILRSIICPLLASEGYIKETLVIPIEFISNRPHHCVCEAILEDLNLLVARARDPFGTHAESLRKNISEVEKRHLEHTTDDIEIYVFSINSNRLLNLKAIPRNLDVYLEDNTLRYMKSFHRFHLRRPVYTFFKYLWNDRLSHDKSDSLESTPSNKLAFYAIQIGLVEDNSTFHRAHSGMEELIKQLRKIFKKKKFPLKLEEKDDSIFLLVTK